MVKYNKDDSVSRFKARFMAKGFHQSLSTDYTKTYSLVVKAQTIKIMMSISVSNGYKIQQVDINNTFINGEGGKDVYLSQPEGFKDRTRVHHVCKLNKPLIG